MLAVGVVAASLRPHHLLYAVKLVVPSVSADGSHHDWYVVAARPHVPRHVSQRMERCVAFASWPMLQWVPEELAWLIWLALPPGVQGTPVHLERLERVQVLEDGTITLTPSVITRTTLAQAACTASPLDNTLITALTLALHLTLDLLLCLAFVAALAE